MFNNYDNVKLASDSIFEEPLSKIFGIKMSTEKDIITGIVPCYNEFERLSTEQFINVLRKNDTIQFCFVNDASTDHTLDLLNGLKQSYPERVHVLDLRKNVGKAEAIRQGVLFMSRVTQSEFIAYLDADLSAPLTELLRLYTIIQSEQLLFVFGSRVAIYGSKINRNFFRHYLGRVFATGASMVLNMVIYDTQCGLKIFHKDIAQELFEKPFISRWLFDIEIIARLKLNYNESEMLNLMKEVPLNEWIEKGDSKLRIRDLLRIPLLFIKIKYHYSNKQSLDARLLKVEIQSK